MSTGICYRKKKKALNFLSRFCFGVDGEGQSNKYPLSPFHPPDLNSFTEETEFLASPSVIKSDPKKRMGKRLAEKSTEFIQKL